MPLPPKQVLQQMAAYSKQPALAMAGSILAANSSAAIMLLPGHDDVELSALAKSCCCCNKMEGQEVRYDESEKK